MQETINAMQNNPPGRLGPPAIALYISSFYNRNRMPQRTRNQKNF